MEKCNWHFMAIMQVTTSVEFRKVLRWYFVTGMLVDLCVAIMQVTVSVAIMQLCSIGTSEKSR